MPVIFDNAVPIAEDATDDSSALRNLNDDEKKICREMVKKLSQSEIETAARSSYNYLSKSLDGKCSIEEREHHATAMALRHLRVVKGDPVSALENMKSTIAYRREIDIDGLRRCFYESDDPDESKVNRYDWYRKNLREQLSTGKAYVRGYDIRGRALFPIIPRRNNSFDPEWYLKGYIYMIERALACTERKTKGVEDKVIVFFDYSGYKSAHAPPLSLAKKLMFILRDHYPERLEHVFVIDAPLAFRAFWILIKPFIDPVTKSKVVFLTGEDAKADKLGVLIEECQAEPFMLPNGTMENDVDLEEFLCQTAFDKGVNEAV